MENIVVSVRIPTSELKKLQLLAQIYGRPIGELIRDAVAKHIKDLAATDEFRTRAKKMQSQYAETLSGMLRSSKRSVPKK